jgi:hypothetical protein
MGLHNVLSMDESRDKLLKSGFHAITSHNQTEVEDEITYNLEDQLTASKIAMLYERYKSEVDNIRLTADEQREMGFQIRSITSACRISEVGADPYPVEPRGFIS